jgi:histidine kinase
VQDEGLGIAPADLGKLFQPFTQVHDQRALNPGGTGLGLFISRGIMELHGGDIVAESAGLGLGATFTFRVPLRGPSS